MLNVKTSSFRHNFSARKANLHIARAYGLLKKFAFAKGNLLAMVRSVLTCLALHSKQLLTHRVVFALESSLEACFVTNQTQLVWSIYSLR